MAVASIPGQNVVTPEHVKIAESMVRESRENDDLIPMDVERFWDDDAAARRDPFGADIPQVPFGASLTGECVFDELGIEEDYRRFETDEAWRLDVSKAYNDKAERMVGRRLLNETPGDPALHYPPVKQLHDVFEAENVWHDRSWWLMPSANDEAELEALLDRVDARLDAGLRDFLLPENWDREKDRLGALGARPPLYRLQRGPVTFAASVFGSEKLLYLIMESPDLAERFRDAILRAMLEIGRVQDEEAGYAPEDAPHGFYFCDDNCCLLTPPMYELFGYPILKAVFERYSPDPGDGRGQHSDSAMGHLLPLLSTLDMTSVNLGPTLTVREIREHLPKAEIHGQLAPFTYSRNKEEQIVLEFLRDFEMAREKRGLVFTTAGSINNGSRLSGMRLLMAAIQRHGTY